MAVNEQDYVGFAPDPRTGTRHVPNHLPKMAVWEDEIYQREDEDMLIGGRWGLDNLPMQQLANRTLYLYTEAAGIRTLARRLQRQNTQLHGLIAKLLPDARILTTSISGSQPTSGDAWIKPSGAVSVMENPHIRIEMNGASESAGHPEMKIVSGGTEVKVLLALGSKEQPAERIPWIRTQEEYPYDGKRPSCIIMKGASDGPRIVSSGGTVSVPDKAMGTIFFSLGEPKKPFGWTGRGTLENPIAKVVTEDGAVVFVSSEVENAETLDAVYMGDYCRIVLAGGGNLDNPDAQIVSDEATWDVKGKNKTVAAQEHFTDTDLNSVFSS